MLDTAQLARLRKLTELIEKERDHAKFEQLIAELNALMDESATLRAFLGEIVRVRRVLRNHVRIS